MSSTAVAHPESAPKGTWAGGNEPFGASYGKLMMWFFLLSDAFTFSGLLITYGMLRVSHSFWPKPDVVFSSIPFFHGVNAPLVFVGVMTFILIMSSVTMVLAVEAGHRKDRDSVLLWMALTIVGGAAFLSCQAWEWTHLIEDGTTIYSNLWGPALADGTRTAGPVNFGQLFFVITGFHGFHVFSGLVILFVVAVMAANRAFDERGTYEMVEKVGLYWHFVDLVWVFVFTSFYLI